MVWASPVGPSRGPPRTGHWASRGPRRKRRAPGPSPVPGHDGDDGGGEAELRELGSPSHGPPGRCVV
nr:MAG TPA: hypothetical protein [Caudoviricetes sp.]